MWWRWLSEVQTEHEHGEERDLSDFERGMVVGARRAGLSISKTADLLGFSRTISRVYREWSEKEKIFQWAAVVWTKMPCWCQRRMGRLVRDDRKATVTQITTRLQPRCAEYHLWTHNTVEPWSWWATAAEDHTGCMLLSAKNRKRRLQSAKLHKRRL